MLTIDLSKTKIKSPPDFALGGDCFWQYAVVYRAEGTKWRMRLKMASKLITPRTPPASAPTNVPVKVSAINVPAMAPMPP